MPMDRERETYASSRRGSLRGLTSLPLIGGGVSLIGRPTAVAEPLTRAALVLATVGLDLRGGAR